MESFESSGMLAVHSADMVFFASIEVSLVSKEKLTWNEKF